MKFIEMCDTEITDLEDDIVESIVALYMEDLDDEDGRRSICEELDMTEDELSEMMEESGYSKHVSSNGKIAKKLSRKVRSRRATQTTGLSKTSLRRRARKAARTKRQNPGGMRKALRKRNKALRKRKQLRIKSS